MTKRLVTLLCVALSLCCQAQWTAKIDLHGAPQIVNLFEEVARIERGIVRYVALDALQSQLEGKECSYDDVSLDFEPDEDYFDIQIGAKDDGSGDASWQRMQGKIWRTTDGETSDVRCIMATYLVDHSPQEEYHYLYFYEYDPQTSELKSIPRPFSLDYPENELRYDIFPDGTIQVIRWGDHVSVVGWDGSVFRVLPPLL